MRARSITRDPGSFLADSEHLWCRARGHGATMAAYARSRATRISGGVTAARRRLTRSETRVTSITTPGPRRSAQPTSADARRRRPRAAHALRRPRRVRRTLAPALPLGHDGRALGDVEPRPRRPRARGVHAHLPVDPRAAADRPARSAPTCSPASATPPRRGGAPGARRRSTRSTPSRTPRRATRRPPTRSTAASRTGRSAASPRAGRRCSGTPRSSG